MTPISAFATAAAPWQTFYVLIGTAAATLVGLMFVAVTFGSNIIRPETSATARSFIDPTFTHFVQVLFMSCLVVVPTMRPGLFGLLLLTMSVLRFAALFRVHRHMRHAQRLHNDIELSDWISGIVVPVICYSLLGLTGARFIEGTFAFSALAIVTIAILMLGVFGAWELMLWMALKRAAASKENGDLPRE
ncbi:MAG TPA: hypothetical protein VH560_01640 [Polyangia bacterium]|jgi:hypothetical protein|nr:hypothetical protein [Polyangia bacterium]